MTGLVAKLDQLHQLRDETTEELIKMCLSEEIASGEKLGCSANQIPATFRDWDIFVTHLLKIEVRKGKDLFGILGYMILHQFC